MKSLLFKWAGRCAPLVLLAACMGDLAADSESALGGDSDALSVVVGPTLLPRVIEFDDPLGVGAQAMREQSFLVTSAAEYADKFGHRPPANIKFESGNVVVFYSAGPKRTGGYDASFTYVRPSSGPGVPTPIASERPDAIVGTLLETPGQGCSVTQALTTPYALALIPRAHYDSVEFRAAQQAVDCVRCDADCDEGEHCELRPVVCVTSPCPPEPSCVADEVDACATAQCRPPARCVDVGGKPVCKAPPPLPRPLPL
jgi:hypothetical protein